MARIQPNELLAIGVVAAQALADLPRDRSPSRREWTAMSRRCAGMVEARIRELERLVADLDDSIGRGCLSLGRCTLFDPGDEADGEGPGSRWVRGGR